MLRSIGKFIWRFMVIFSFIVNLVLVVVLIGLVVFIFNIKNDIADPLVGGLHSTAAGLENATIDWTIPVRDTIPVNLDINLNTDTVVVLNAPVPLTVTARIDLPGINAYNVAANVNLELPQGLALPVALNVPVPVRETMDIALDVRAVIPLSQTQLKDPIQTLGLLFEPLAIGLHNLPSDWNGAFQMVGDILGGESLNLLDASGSPYNNNTPYDPWPGYSMTAGLGYELMDQPVPPQNLAASTNIVPLGGIPLLDSQLPARKDLYANGGSPAEHNAIALQNLQAQALDPSTYDGTMADQYLDAQGRLPASTTQNTSNGAQSVPPANNGNGGQPVVMPSATAVPNIGGSLGSTGDVDVGIITPTPHGP